MLLILKREEGDKNESKGSEWSKDFETVRVGKCRERKHREGE